MKNEKYIDVENKIKSILTSDNRKYRYGRIALQNRFDREITKLQEFGISGFHKSFLNNIAEDNRLATRQRINRLLKNSKVLFAQSYCYVKANTTLLKYLYTRYGELLPNGDRFLQNHKRYVYKLIDRFHLRRKSIIFRFSSEYTTLK